MKTQKIDTGRLAINVAIAGDGPPVVLLHGLGWDHHLWDRQLRDLSSKYQVIAPDTRGHGLSDVPDGPYSIAAYRDDLLSLLDTLKLDKVTLIGFSQGGMTALTMATSMPERLKALGVLCSVEKGHPDGQANMEKRIAAMDAQGPEAAARIAGASVFSEAFIASRLDYFESFVAHRVKANAKGLIAAMRAGAGYDLSSKVGAIDLPTLVVAGGVDKLAPPQAVRVVADMIPGSSFHLFPECGHMVPIEAPAEFDALLEGFLDRVHTETVDA
ncbi:3-oxoadipate enol-lactonase [soil metagenome]